MNAKKDRLYRDVEFLTKIRPKRHNWNPDSFRKASNYTREEFNKTGLETEKQKWREGREKFANIIASYNKEKSKRLIISAHYDLTGNTLAPDDNASALAGLLETARIVQENKPDIDYRIDFVAYSLEEPLSYCWSDMGSYMHASSLKEINADVIGMICLEMTGYFSKQLINEKFNPEQGEYIAVVGNKDYAAFNEEVYRLMAESSGIDIQLANFSQYVDWSGRFDHWPYWEYNYPSLLINAAAFLQTPDYPGVPDSIDKLNFDKMAEVINSIYQAVINLG